MNLFVDPASTSSVIENKGYFWAIDQVIGLFKDALSSEDGGGPPKGNLTRSGLDCSEFGVAGVTFEVL